jgi:hypothetical protein
MGSVRKLDKAVWWFLFVAVMAFAVWIRVFNPPAPRMSGDEAMYVAYATKIVQDPLHGPRDLVARYNSAARYWVYPFPLRIGYLYLIAGVMKLVGCGAARAGVILSTASSILEFACVAGFGLRFFNRWTVLAALALLSVSPQDLAMARRVWADGVAACGAMMFIWICAEISVRPRARLWFAALWLWGGFFLLLKESGGFFFGFCLLGLAVESWRQTRSWKRPAAIFTGALATAVCSFSVMALACGGLGPALDAARHTGSAALVNPYGINYQSGPWYSYAIGLWVLSPFTAFCCAVGLVALIRPRNPLGEVLALDQSQRDIALGLGGLILLVIITATLPSTLKSIRYLSFIFGPWYLMAALGLTYLMVRARNAFGASAALPLTAVFLSVIVFSCWSDYWLYRDLFIRRAIPDLAIRLVATSPFEPGL